MPSRLKPTNPTAQDAILVGDPGRALMLAQEILVKPLMSNHARGLWGYTSATPNGDRLSIQATGMGGPSAAIVLSDLVKLGVRRAIRVGTCESLTPQLAAGTVVVVERTIAADGTSRMLLGAPSPPSEAPPPAVSSDPVLGKRLAGAGLPVTGLSTDLGAAVAEAAGLGGAERIVTPAEATVVDLQTAALFALGRQLGIAVAAILIVESAPSGALNGAAKSMVHLDSEQLEEPVKRAGAAAAAALSIPQLQP